MGFIFSGKRVKYRSVFCACIEFFIVYIYINKLLFVCNMCTLVKSPSSKLFSSQLAPSHLTRQVIVYTARVSEASQRGLRGFLCVWLCWTFDYIHPLVPNEGKKKGNNGAQMNLMGQNQKQKDRKRDKGQLREKYTPHGCLTLTRAFIHC